MALSDELAARTAAALAPEWPRVQVAGFAELTGGASSLTYAADLVDGPAPRVVVKVAPPGLAPVRNRDVLRQASVLTRLAGQADVLVPQVFARDVGQPPDEPPLFVMSFEPGDSAEPLFVAADLEPELVRARALHAARMVAALHRTPVDDLADESVSPQQEVEKWDRALATVPVEILAGPRERFTPLLDRVPEAVAPALSHGDWRLGNTLCVAGEIRSVIDWEIWTVGDPRADLSWLLTMCDPTHPAAIAGPETGMPTIAELVSEYERAAGYELEELAWFRGLAAYKQTVTTALIAKHSAKRGVPMEQVTDRMSRLLPELFDWAAALATAPAPARPQPRSAT